MSLQYNEKIIPLAKELRTNATPQKNHLWYDYLRSYPVRFQRQKTIDNFISDFYCHDAKLIIEIDGSQHYTVEGQQKDELRTEVPEGYNLTVIRVTNRQVDDNFQGACLFINKIVNERLETKETQ